MWHFKRTLRERYSKLVKVIKHIDTSFKLKGDKENSLRLHMPDYKGNQPMLFCIQRTFFVILSLLSSTIAFAQRYSGHGRGMSNDSFSFGSPSWNETLIMIIVSVIAIPLSSLFINYANKKEEGKGTIYWILGGVFGLVGFVAVLPLIYHYWYIVILLALLGALYGAYKNG